MHVGWDTQCTLYYWQKQETHTQFEVSNFMEGRVIAQVVSRQLPTAAATVRSQVKSCEICG
jgi:hypothetical protein